MNYSKIVIRVFDANKSIEFIKKYIIFVNRSVSYPSYQNSTFIQRISFFAEINLLEIKITYFSFIIILYSNITQN